MGFRLRRHVFLHPLVSGALVNTAFGEWIGTDSMILNTRLIWLQSIPLQLLLVHWDWKPTLPHYFVSWWRHPRLYLPQFFLSQPPSSPLLLASMISAGIQLLATPLSMQQLRPETPVLSPRVGLDYQAPLIAFLLDGVSLLLTPPVFAQLATRSRALHLRVMTLFLRL